ncbi:reverse transcriptase domain-containing protein [Tanacetum coccineum]
MRTRSSFNLIVESSTIPKRCNHRRSKQIVEPEIRSIVETPVATMADTRTMSELLQEPTDGYRDAIVIPTILAENFELKVGLLQLTTNLKNDIMNFQQRFDETFSEAWDRFKDLLRKCPHHGFLKLHQIDTFYNALTQSDQDSLNAAAGGNLLNRTPRDALTIIENKFKVRTSRNKPIVSKATVKAIEETCVICGGPHPYYECLATCGNTFDACAAVWTYNQGGNGYRPQGDPNYHASNQMGPPGFPPPNVQNNQNYNQNRYNQNQGNYQALNNQGFNQQRGQNFNQGNNNYQAPNNQAQVGPSNGLSNYMKTNENNELKNVVNNEIRNIMSNELKNTMTNFLQMQYPSGSGSLPSNTVANPRGDLKSITTRSGVSYDGPTIPPTSSPLPKEAECEPEVTRNKKKLSLPELTLTRITLKLTNQSVAYPIGVAEDVFVKVGKFYFLADFVVGDYDVNPWVPLILGRPFLRTTQALLDIHGEELTLHVNDEAITFKVGHTSRYSYKYDDELVNQIDVIDVTCEEYAQEVLGFSDSSKSGNPTLSLDPIITTSSPSLTPFEGGDFILEEIEACLTNDSIPPGIDDDDFDSEGDISLLEKLLSDDPSSPLPPKELNFEELKIIKNFY